MSEGYMSYSICWDSEIEGAPLSVMEDAEGEYTSEKEALLDAMGALNDVLSDLRSRHRKMQKRYDQLQQETCNP